MQAWEDGSILDSSSWWDGVPSRACLPVGGLVSWLKVTPDFSHLGLWLSQAKTNNKYS